MIALLAALALPVQAEQGRTTASATVGATAQHHELVARGSLEYGLRRRVGITAELGALPDVRGVDCGVGLTFDLVGSRWVRLNATAYPALTLGLPGQEPRGLDLPLPGPDVVLRGGLRLHWMAFWGASLSLRADQVLPLDGAPGWTELAVGAGVRM